MYTGDELYEKVNMHFERIYRKEMIYLDFPCTMGVSVRNFVFQIKAYDFVDIGMIIGYGRYLTNIAQDWLASVLVPRDKDKMIPYIGPLYRAIFNRVRRELSMRYENDDFVENGCNKFITDVLAQILCMIHKENKITAAHIKAVMESEWR